MRTDTNPSGVTSTSIRRPSSEEMFKLADKGDMLVANDKEHKILKVGLGKLGQMISVEYNGKHVELYFKEAYQSLQMFVPDKGWECFPGSTNFKIKSLPKK